MNEIITASIPTVVTALLTYLVTRRKYLVDVKKARAEAKGNEIDNVEKAVKIWRGLTEDIKMHLGRDIEELRKENAVMKEKLNLIIRENEQLREQMSVLEKKLLLAKQENDKLSTQLYQFRKNFEMRPATRQTDRK